MKVVVSGGAGFIGANLCRVLSGRDEIEQVVVIDDESTGSRLNLSGLAVEYVHGSILQPEDLDSCFVDAVAVVHLAALPSVPRSLVDPLATHHANATGTVEVLEAARRSKVPHVIVASSSSVYGANPAPRKHEELPTSPLSPYAASKLVTEAYAIAWSRSFGLDVLALRFFNVFGPLQSAGHAYAAVIPTFISAALADQPLTIYGDGKQTLDFTFVDDVATIITEAVIGRVASDEPVNLAFGGRSSLLDVIHLLEEILDQSLNWVHREARKGDVRDSQADQSRLRALFPQMEPISLKEGLERTVVWWQNAAHQM